MIEQPYRVPCDRGGSPQSSWTLEMPIPLTACGFPPMSCGFCRRPPACPGHGLARPGPLGAPRPGVASDDRSADRAQVMRALKLIPEALPHRHFHASAPRAAESDRVHERLHQQDPATAGTVRFSGARGPELRLGSKPWPSSRTLMSRPSRSRSISSVTGRVSSRPLPCMIALTSDS